LDFVRESIGAGGEHEMFSRERDGPPLFVHLDRP
jgi:hypothetical protein